MQRKKSSLLHRSMLPLTTSYTGFIDCAEPRPRDGVSPRMHG